MSDSQTRANQVHFNCGGNKQTVSVTGGVETLPLQELIFHSESLLSVSLPPAVQTSFCTHRPEFRKIGFVGFLVVTTLYSHLMSCPQHDVIGYTS